mmetsp:Transcript_15720/g.37550  ORF Transcript_15720/g.37550 Transcript_15720/m.37550 type:complete len:230 (+) Transcript_15720:1122-1811(+)
MPSRALLMVSTHSWRVFISLWWNAVMPEASRISKKGSCSTPVLEASFGGRATAGCDTLLNGIRCLNLRSWSLCISFPSIFSPGLQINRASLKRYKCRYPARPNSRKSPSSRRNSRPGCTSVIPSGIARTLAAMSWTRSRRWKVRTSSFTRPAMFLKPWLHSDARPLIRMSPSLSASLAISSKYNWYWRRRRVGRVRSSISELTNSPFSPPTLGELPTVRSPTTSPPIFF